MSMKRLAIPLCAICVLLAVAGLLELFAIVFSMNSQAVASEGDSSRGSVSLVKQVKSAVVHERNAQKAREADAIMSARSLVESGAIELNGAALDQETAEKLVGSAAGFASLVQYVDQLAVLPSGCELVATAVAMNAEGAEVSAVDLANRLRFGSNIARDYLGDPIRDGGGLPPVVVAAANQVAVERSLGVRAVDMTGTTSDGVLALVRLGYPVVTWVTEGLEKPRFVGTAAEGLQWYTPEHCVVVYGVEDGEVLVSDSLEGLVRRDLQDFSQVYEACGCKSLMIIPDAV